MREKMLQDVLCEQPLIRVFGCNVVFPYKSEWKAFKNPWTKDVEFLIAKNNVILTDTRNYDTQCRGSETGNETGNYDFFHQCKDFFRIKEQINMIKNSYQLQQMR
jgi:hypothetical protein